MKRSIFHYSIDEVAPYIDWSYFLHAWGMGNTGKQSSTASVADASLRSCMTTPADALLDDARAMLKELDGKYCTHALFALCDARGDGDNLVIEGITLPLLRQQHALAGKPNLCLSDFVSPHGDSIGLFATTVDGKLGEEFAGDDYKRIMAQALADRLAEATATLMHRTVRTKPEFWGYAPEEQLGIEELNREEYQGIRPAVGYPSLPDQSVIFIIDRILKLTEIGITLTPNGAMAPHASVCGIMIAHPLSKYFGVGEISEEQLDDYCLRRGLPRENVRKFLARNISEEKL